MNTSRRNRFVPLSEDVSACAAHPLNGFIVAGTKVCSTVPLQCFFLLYYIFYVFYFYIIQLCMLELLCCCTHYVTRTQYWADFQILTFKHLQLELLLLTEWMKG